MKKNKWKAILFDMDGTLLDTKYDLAMSYNRALKDAGYPERRLDEYGLIVGSGISEAIRRAAPAGTSSSELQRIRSFYNPQYTAATKAYLGIVRTLQALFNKGILLGIITNKEDRTANLLVRQYFSMVSFDLIWGSDEMRPLKPSAELGLSALESLNLKPEQAAFVGDSDVDILFAKNTGMASLGASWGFRGEAELIRAGADFILKNPEDILTLI